MPNIVLLLPFFFRPTAQHMKKRSTSLENKSNRPPSRLLFFFSETIFARAATSSERQRVMCCPLCCPAILVSRESQYIIKWPCVSLFFPHVAARPLCQLLTRLCAWEFEWKCALQEAARFKGQRKGTKVPFFGYCNHHNV